MAKLVDSPESQEMLNTKGMNFSQAMDHQHVVLRRLQDNTENLPDGQIVGAVIDFPVADGKAFYLVVKERPLEMSHLPYGDAYGVHPALIKGLDKNDVLAHVKQAKAFAALFKRKAPSPA